jgi:glucuronokinase
MRHFAALAARGCDALLAQDAAALSALINENFDTRHSIYQLPPWQVKMVEVARDCGASAKFAGSGGAIIGVYQGEEMFTELSDRMAEIGSITIKPVVVE